MPGHTGGRHAPRAGATDYRSLGSAWPTVSRNGRRIASARRSRGGNRRTRGPSGETLPGASGGRPPLGSPRTVAVVALRPWCPFRFPVQHFSKATGKQPVRDAKRRHLRLHRAAHPTGGSCEPGTDCGSYRARTLGRYRSRSSCKVAHASPPWISGTMRSSTCVTSSSRI